MSLSRYSILCLFLLTGCTAKPPATEIGETCAALFDEASRHYAEQEFKAHARTVGRTISVISRLPLSTLDGCEVQFHQTLRDSDVRAHLSIAIELAYRHTRSGTRSSNRRYSQIARLVKPALNNKKVGGSTVLLRSSPDPKYRPYSENAGHVTAKVIFSDLGRAWLAQSATPEDLLRGTEMFRECLGSRDRDIDACNRLEGDFEQAFPENDNQSPPQSMVSIMTNGMQRGLEACLAASAGDDIPSAVAIRDAADCTVDALSGWQSQYTTGVGGGGRLQFDPRTDGPPTLIEILENYNDGVQEPGDRVEDCSSGTCMYEQFGSYDYTSKTDSSDTIEVTVHSYSDLEGSSHSTLTVTEQNSNGQWQKTYVDGSLVSVQFNSADGNDSYSVYFNDDGTRTGQVITRTDEDTGLQTVIVSEYDDDGNLINKTVYVQRQDQGTATCDPSLSTDCDDPAQACDSEKETCKSATNSTPIPDDIGDMCWGDPTDDLRITDSLLPWTMPDPNGPDSTEMDDCLSRYFSQEAQACPPSVILCLDPEEITNCECKQSATSSIRGQSACNLTDCAPDGVCDPTTGACKTGDGSTGGLFPGTGITPRFDIPDTVLTCVTAVTSGGVEALSAAFANGDCQ